MSYTFLFKWVLYNFAHLTFSLLQIQAHDIAHTIFFFKFIKYLSMKRQSWDLYAINQFLHSELLLENKQNMTCGYNGPI